MTSLETPTFAFENVFARDLSALAVEWEPTPVPDPRLVVANRPLADDLGIEPAHLAGPDGVAVLAGNAIPDGASPVAMAYAGHQFGGYSPRLGDGRALLLGELIDRSGTMRDVHLKGSGRTPFARGGDGKAALGPMLREYLISEAMHALGIPTTRALAVVTTGEHIHREEGMVPGAVLTRVAASHLRVGMFEYAARIPDPAVVRDLADHAIARHHPAAADAADPYLALLEAVADAQASLVARWMLVGFIHGVMNTDNMTISGEGIDYGPCAFMDRYDPATVFSSIDRMGRYAYGNQPAIAQWNLARLAETLLRLMDGDEESAVAAATEVLNGFAERYHGYWQDGMRAKLGLAAAEREDGALFGDLLVVLREGGVDFTQGFRSLAGMLRGDRSVDALGGGEEAGAWVTRWQDRLAREGRDVEAVAAGMDAVNPVYVPRNHLVEEALAAALAGDLASFERLQDVLAAPFEERPGLELYAEPAPQSFTDGYRTFCGT